MSLCNCKIIRLFSKLFHRKYSCVRRDNIISTDKSINLFLIKITAAIRKIIIVNNISFCMSLIKLGIQVRGHHRILHYTNFFTRIGRNISALHRIIGGILIDIRSLCGRCIHRRAENRKCKRKNRHEKNKLSKRIRKMLCLLKMSVMIHVEGFRYDIKGNC